MQLWLVSQIQTSAACTTRSGMNRHSNKENNVLVVQHNEGILEARTLFPLRTFSIISSTVQISHAVIDSRLDREIAPNNNSNKKRLMQGAC